MDAEAVTDEHSRSGRQNRVVPIPRRWDQPPGHRDVGPAADTLRAPGGRWLESPARRGERVYAVNQSRREGRVAPVEPVVIFLSHSTGATSIRSSLRPLIGRGDIS